MHILFTPWKFTSRGFRLQNYLKRFTWRHDSVLKFISKTPQTLNTCKLYADLPEMLNPSIITGDHYRPDILLIPPGNTLYFIELTVGFESNLNRNVTRKKSKYADLIKELQQRNFNSTIFINLSISSFGVFDPECSYIIFGNVKRLRVRQKPTTILHEEDDVFAIRATYYIFSCRNKEWENPGLLNY